MLSRQQGRLRAALAKLSDVCQRNSKLTEAVLSKQSGVANNSNNKYKVQATPPTPPLRTVSLFKIKTLRKVETRKEIKAETETKSGRIIGELSDNKENKPQTSDHPDLEEREEKVTENDEGDVGSCQSSERVKRSLENLSVPSWYTKHQHRSQSNTHNKWRRKRTEVGTVQSICYLNVTAFIFSSFWYGRNVRGVSCICRGRKSSLHCDISKI